MEGREPYLKIWQDLARDKSMIFLTGPRQAGKTTLAQIISRSFSNIHSDFYVLESPSLLFPPARGEKSNAEC